MSLINLVWINFQQGLQVCEWELDALNEWEMILELEGMDY